MVPPRRAIRLKDEEAELACFFFLRVVRHFGFASCAPTHVPDRSPNRAVMHMKWSADTIRDPIQILSNPNATRDCTETGHGSEGQIMANVLAPFSVCWSSG